MSMEEELSQDRVCAREGTRELSECVCVCARVCIARWCQRRSSHGCMNVCVREEETERERMCLCRETRHSYGFAVVAESRELDFSSYPRYIKYLIGGID